MDIKELYKIFCEHPVITTDTRDCPQGSIFFALKGASFNGNDFAIQALEKGCAYAVVDEINEEFSILHSPFIVVDDVLATLQQLARWHRQQLGTPVIGVTGTNGKTTTKELLAAVLGEKYNVHYTRGNFNNHIGVPKTLLQMTSEHDIAVIEMGANHPGEIKTLVDIVEPDCGLITNVGRAHLGGFGSFEGVKATKGELYDYLNGKRKMENGECHSEPTAAANSSFSIPHSSFDKGFAFLNMNDADLCEMAAARGIATVPYIEGRVVCCNPFVKAEIDGNIIQTKLIGSYNLPNMLAAATVGRHFGVSDQQICHALENYTPSNNRSQLTVTEHNRLVVDAYNANPTSMAAALSNFRAMEVDNKMMILGSMGELGEVSREEHSKIISMILGNSPSSILHSPFADVWLVGSEFAAIDHPFRQFADVEAVKEAIRAEQPQGKYILIKGSNSQKLFQLPELL